MIELICNPIAGNGSAKAAVERAVQKLNELGIAYQLHYTERSRHATEIAEQAALRGAEKVISFGGDGTVTEVANGLKNTNTALAIVPCGTGNDFAKAVNIPKDLDRSLDIALNTPARPVDFGMINDELFMNICGTGFDVMVLDYADQVKKYVKGIWPYLYGVIRTIFKFKPSTTKVEVDGQLFEKAMLICCVGNGQFFGGGIPIIPYSNAADSMLEVLMVDAISRWKMPFYLLPLLKGTLYQKKVSHPMQAKHVVIEKKGMRVNIDGEIRMMNKADITIFSDQLLLCW